MNRIELKEKLEDLANRLGYHKLSDEYHPQFYRPLPGGLFATEWVSEEPDRVKVAREEISRLYLDYSPIIYGSIQYFDSFRDTHNGSIFTSVIGGGVRGEWKLGVDKPDGIDINPEYIDTLSIYVVAKRVESKSPFLSPQLKQLPERILLDEMWPEIEKEIIRWMTVRRR